MRKISVEGGFAYELHNSRSCVSDLLTHGSAGPRRNAHSTVRLLQHFVRYHRLSQSQSHRYDNPWSAYDTLRFQGAFPRILRLRSIICPVVLVKSKQISRFSRHADLKTTCQS